MPHRIYTQIDRPPADFARRFLATKYEIAPSFLPRTQMADAAIKPLLLRDWKFAGPAVTVSQDRASTTMSIAMIGVAQPGDIIVVAAQGDMTSASWGGGLTRSAKNVGVAGVVVDGAVLDTTSILQRDVPVFCRGATLVHDTRPFPGSINVPVSFGGVIVHPGDYVIGDLDGVAVIPKADIESVLLACEERHAEILGLAARMDGEKATIFGLQGGRATTEALGVRWIDTPKVAWID